MSEHFEPRYDAQGLIVGVVVHAVSGSVMMVAFLDAEALAETRRTGFAHFYSRSRRRLWKKGETSGNILTVKEILVDCDQDALVLRCEPAGPVCHTGAKDCFFRRLEDNALMALD